MNQYNIYKYPQVQMVVIFEVCFIQNVDVFVVRKIALMKEKVRYREVDKEREPPREGMGLFDIAKNSN